MGEGTGGGKPDPARLTAGEGGWGAVAALGLPRVYSGDFQPLEKNTAIWKEDLEEHPCLDGSSPEGPLTTHLPPARMPVGDIFDLATQCGKGAALAEVIPGPAVFPPPIQVPSPHLLSLEGSGLPSAF